ncbi:MAG: hypothetical protein MUF34_21370, partial [Polyangiaceae bacterium]|nr:hypothetical protein [Polyangiaceae bacterium]
MPDPRDAPATVAPPGPKAAPAGPKAAPAAPPAATAGPQAATAASPAAPAGRRQGNALSDEETTFLEGLKKLEKSLGKSNDRYRDVNDFTAEQRAQIAELFGPQRVPLLPRRVADLALPPLEALRRCVGLDSPSVYEAAVGPWPAWRWLKRAALGDVEPAAAIEALARGLGPGQARELALRVALHDDEYALFIDHRRALVEGEREAFVARVLALLGSMVDAAGEGEALAFARDVAAKLAGGRPFWIAALASMALASAARRRREPFPSAYVPLVRASRFVPGGISVAEAMREVVATMSLADRQAFVEGLDHPFSSFYTWHRVERVDGKAKKVPIAAGAWVYADLLPTPANARAVVDTMAAWEPRPQPVERALEVIRALGALCVPPLEDAIKGGGRNLPTLRAALAALGKGTP